jgi:NAD(P)-dependent dehydrogenase (short-subunit alcohol dehydrogenase family)
MILKGKRALVTGAAKGIGKGIARRLGDAGCSVVLADILEETVRESAKELAATGLDARGVGIDLSKTAELPQAVSALVEEGGPIDILVNNAGTISWNPALELTEAEWDLVFDVNAKGLFFLTQAVARTMVESRRGGRIINIASIGAKIPFENQVHYCSSKSAVLGMTRVMAVEWASHGITVNAICPGAINGDVLKNSYKWVAERIDRDPEDVLAEWLAPVPLGRLIEPEEIGDVAVFLASEAGRTITGQSINVDGGRIFS